MPSAPYDVGHEYVDLHGDPNGLPPASSAEPTILLDAKALTYAGLTHPALGYEWGFPHNEWLVPEVYPDGDGGRTRSILPPGAIRFHALYGEWVDRDQDRVVDVTDDAHNEWVGYEAVPHHITDMLGFVTPGHHPPLVSDHYYFGEFVTDDHDGGHTRDFKMVDRGGGHWITSHTIPFLHEGLVQRIEVAIMANGTEMPSLAPGYTCLGAADNCRVDVDAYEAVHDDVAFLYTVTTEIVHEVVASEVEPRVNPVLQPVQAAVMDVTLLAAAAVHPAPVSEVDPADPYASMTETHGATRDVGGYDYASTHHAYADLRLNMYLTEGNGAVLAARPIGVPDADLEARGLAPMLVGVHGHLGTWFDADADGIVADAEFIGSCNLDRGATTSGPVPTSTEDESTTGTSELQRPSYLNHPSQLSETLAITGVLEAVDDNGGPVPWGTGVYVLSEDDESHLTVGGRDVDRDVVWYDDAAWDLQDLTVDRYVIEGPIPFEIHCDEDDPGEWFTTPWYGGSVILFPAGTHGFHVRLTTDDGFVLRFTDAAGSSHAEAFRDVDLYRRWA